jgi:hypothetical protein
LAGIAALLAGGWLSVLYRGLTQREREILRQQR